jgi:hypothetical protein
MNQVNNLIQYKNFTDKQKDAHDWAYQYEFQAYGDAITWQVCSKNTGRATPRIDGERVYRLKIEDDKWYYIEHMDGDKGVWQAKDLGEEPEEYFTLRPATAAEVPKPVREFKDGAYYAALLVTGIDDIEVTFMYNKGRFHIGGVSFQREDLELYKLSDFSWIGEELNIAWGKG